MSVRILDNPGFTNFLAMGQENPVQAELEDVPIWDVDRARKYALPGQELPSRAKKTLGAKIRKWLGITLMVSCIFGVFIGMMITFYKPMLKKSETQTTTMALPAKILDLPTYTTTGNISLWNVTRHHDVTTGNHHVTTDHHHVGIGDHNVTTGQEVTSQEVMSAEMTDTSTMSNVT